MIMSGKRIVYAYFLFGLIMIMATAEAKKIVPMLGENVESESYRISKVSEQDMYFAGFDNDKDEYYLDFKRLIEYIIDDPLPDGVKDKLSGLRNLKQEDLYLDHVANSWIDYSTQWTRKSRALRITRFKIGRYESDVSPYAGPLELIPIIWEGKATYELKHNGEVIRFQSFAEKFVWSLRGKYQAFIDVYEPREEWKEKIPFAVLIVYAPMDNYKHNGAYLVHAK